jgi:hypothetical protein
MKSKLADYVLEGLLQLHEELSVDPEAPWYLGAPDQTQVLHQQLWTLAAAGEPRLQWCVGGLHRETGQEQACRGLSTQGLAARGF